MHELFTTFLTSKRIWKFSRQHVMLKTQERYSITAIGQVRVSVKRVGEGG